MTKNLCWLIYNNLFVACFQLTFRTCSCGKTLSRRIAWGLGWCESSAPDSFWRTWWPTMRRCRHQHPRSGRSEQRQKLAESTNMFEHHRRFWSWNFSSLFEWPALECSGAAWNWSAKLSFLCPRPPLKDKKELSNIREAISALLLRKQVKIHWSFCQSSSSSSISQFNSIFEVMRNTLNFHGRALFYARSIFSAKSGRC